MGLDASELARWTRFAHKGGIGKCTALQDCIAESPEDLMFLKDDEITVLLQLPSSEGRYLGYCEGVVGQFSGDHVRFHAKLKRAIMTKRSSSLSVSGKSPTPSRFMSPSPAGSSFPPSPMNGVFTEEVTTNPLRITKRAPPEEEPTHSPHVSVLDARLDLEGKDTEVGIGLSLLQGLVDDASSDEDDDDTTENVKTVEPAHLSPTSPSFPRERAASIATSGKSGSSMDEIYDNYRYSRRDPIQLARTMSADSDASVYSSFSQVMGKDKPGLSVNVVLDEDDEGSIADPITRKPSPVEQRRASPTPLSPQVERQSLQSQLNTPKSQPPATPKSPGPGFSIVVDDDEEPASDFNTRRPPTLAQLREPSGPLSPSGKRQSLFMPHPNAPKAPPPGAAAGPMYVVAATTSAPPARQSNVLGVIHQALGPRPPSAVRRGPTIYGRTETDLVSATGPVPIVWSVEPMGGATAPPPVNHPPAGAAMPIPRPNFVVKPRPRSKSFSSPAPARETKLKAGRPSLSIPTPQGGLRPTMNTPSPLSKSPSSPLARTSTPSNPPPSPGAVPPSPGLSSPTSARPPPISRTTLPSSPESPVRNKLSLPNLRHARRQDDTASISEAELLQVQDMEFELVRPSFSSFHMAAARTSEDSNVLGREGSIRTESPVASTVTLPVKEEGAEAHRARETKWIAMMSQSRKNKKVRKLVGEGVPSSVRYPVWSFLTDAKAKCVPGVYEQLCSRGRVGCSDVMERDIQRCFTDQPHLMGKKGPVQTVLQAYLTMVPDVSYSMGLTLIAGQLLLLAPEEDAFWILVSLMDTHLRSFFSPSSNQLDVDAMLFIEALEGNDRDLVKRLPGPDLLTVCTAWFTTLFVDVLPPEYVLRVWDHFLYDGIPFLFRVGLALVLAARPRLSNGSDMKEILTHPSMSWLPPSPDALCAMALGVKMKDEDLAKRRTKMEGKRGARMTR